MRILHLEDSPQDAELIGGLIRREWKDCKICWTTQRKEYVEALSSGGFDLILSDYSMPGFDGLTALKLAQTCCPEKPFIFLSGTIGEERAVEALQHGATDYVIKDRPSRLVPAIRLALDRLEAGQRRAQAEAELRQNQERLFEQASLLELARDAICATDLEQTVSYWNAGAVNLYGWKAEEAIGRNLHALIFRHDDTRYSEVIRKVLANHEWHGEMLQSTKTGESVMVDSRWTLVPDTAGQPKSILIINTDATERKNLETQLLRAQRLESIGTLASGIAHDLNNVFSPILMAIPLLESVVTDASGRELLVTMEKSTEHGAALIRQLLTYARGSGAKRIRLQVEPIVHELEKLLRQTLPDRIKLEVYCPADSWWVNADATQLSQVLMNLCVNARDAMPDGGSLDIRIGNVAVTPASARTLPEGRAGRFLCLSVADTGVGIPSVILEKIFDPFFTTKEMGKGTGLGLSTVRGIVRSHEGFIHVETVLGQGTLFQVFLPAMDGSVAESAPTAPDLRMIPPGRGEGILVIDDDAAVRAVTSVLLGRAGYKVMVAADGTAGVEAYRNHPGKIDVVLTDMMMPGLTGSQVIQALRLINPGVGIIAMSGLLDAGVLTENLNLDRLDFLPKPLNARTLLATIHRRLTDPSRAAAGHILPDAGRTTHP